MKKSNRKAAQRAPVVTAAVPPPAPMSVPLPPLPDGPTSAPLWLLAVGAALLLVPLLLPAPELARAPRAIGLVSALAGLSGLVAATVGFVPALHAKGGAAVAIAAGVGAILAALGLAPEWLAWPGDGAGERLFGFPVLALAPIAGAALLSDRPRTVVLVGGGAATLLLAALVHPSADLDVVSPAFLHQWRNGSWAGFALVILAALGVAGAVLGGRPTDRVAGPWLARTAGAALLLALPAWLGVLVVRGLPVLGLLALVVGASLLVIYGLRRRSESPGAAPALAIGRLSAHAVEAVLVVGAIGLWLLLKSYTWRWSTTDENIYFYGAKITLEGQLPYRDFFFAHPPMHLVVPGIFFKLFGFSIGLAKAIPVGSSLVTGLLIWHLGRVRLGRVAAFLALAAFLYAHELLQASTNMNGVELTSLWLTAGLWAIAFGRPLLAGAALGVAVTTGFYAIGGALALVAMALTRGRFGLRVLMAFLAVAGGINLLFWFVGGDDFLAAVYGYHVKKDEKPLIGEFLKALYHHTPLFVGLLLAPALGAWQRFRGYALPGGNAEPEQPGSFFAPFKLWDEPGLGSVKMAFLVCATLLVEFTMFQELYAFYFALLFPTAAYCTGYSLAAIGGAIVDGLHALTARQIRPFAVAMAFTVAWGLWLPLAVEANWAFSNPGRGKDALPAKGVNPEWLERGEVRPYPWIAPAAWDAVATPVVKALFWRDHRLKGEITPGFRHFLWQKALHLDAADEIAAFVRDGSEPDETVAGNSLVAPLVALVADRRIAGNQLDTNGKRYKTGNTTLEAFFTAICKDRIRYLVAAPSGFFSDSLLSSLPTVRTYFTRVKQIASPMNKFERPGAPPFAVSFWEVRDRTADAEGYRCRWIDPRAGR
ncbi:MAG: hypothetical protein IV100_14975 [Myxococcales bacterium]|nr:hypothetical protein [Myxococcales bacterium]